MGDHQLDTGRSEILNAQRFHCFLLLFDCQFTHPFYTQLPFSERFVSRRLRIQCEQSFPWWAFFPFSSPIVINAHISRNPALSHQSLFFVQVLPRTGSLRQEPPNLANKGG